MPSYRHSKQQNTAAPYPLAGSANKEEINTYTETKNCIFIEMSIYLLISFVCLFIYVSTDCKLDYFSHCNFNTLTAINRIWIC